MQLAQSAINGVRSDAHKLLRLSVRLSNLPDGADAQVGEVVEAMRACGFEVVMKSKVGVWIDHKRAVIVTAAESDVTTKTLESDVEAHPRYGGQQDSGGEQKYEERHRQQLDRYYKDVIGHLGQPEALLILGPGEAKLELEKRLKRSKTASERTVDIETADKLTNPQIVAKVKQHFGIDR